MRAVVCIEPGRLEAAGRHAPDALPEGWVRLPVRQVGSCGTDYRIFAGKHPFLEYPRSRGHEVPATVLDPGTSALAAGAPVVVSPCISCGACIACRKGKPNCCTA